MKEASNLKTGITTSGQLGPFLKRLRMQRRLSQAAPGKKDGLSQEFISRIENQPEAVALDQILTVLMALEIMLTVGARFPVSDDASASATASGGLPAGERDTW